MISFKRIEEFIIKKNYLTNSIGLARSILALGLFLTLLFNSNDVLFYLNSGAIEFQINQYNFFSIYLLIQNTQIAKLISIVVLFFVIIGIYPRITCLLHFWVTYSFSSCVHIPDGGDQIATIISFLLIPVFLLNPNRWHWQINKTKSFYSNTVAFYSILLIKLQTIVIYFHSSVGKFPVVEWTEGSAIYYWFNDPVFGLNNSLKPFFDIIFKNSILTFYANWGVMFLELFIVLAVITSSKKIKKYALIMGLLFHFFIILVHGLFSFYFSMASLLILSLYSENIRFSYRKAYKLIPN
jgi:antimicrobial peptide system SdpB family protein